MGSSTRPVTQQNVVCAAEIIKPRPSRYTHTSIRLLQLRGENFFKGGGLRLLLPLLQSSSQIVTTVNKPTHTAFYKPDALPVICHPTNSVGALKEKVYCCLMALSAQTGYIVPQKYNVYHVGQGNNTIIQLNSETME